jgi:hypothetical protein
MRFTISEANQPLHCVSFDSNKYPDTRALSVGRSSGCVFSLKNLSWVGSRVGRTHFSLIRQGEAWVALASSENHQLFFEGKPSTRVELQQPGCKFQFGNCLFTVDEMDCPGSNASNFLLQISEGGSSRMIPLPSGGSLSIGRAGSDCNVALQTPYCSRTHAILRHQGEEVFLEDVSTNGTMIGNQVLKNATQKVKPGQQINIDSAKLQLFEVNPPAPAFKMIHLLLILLVGVVAVLLLYPKEEAKSAKLDSKPPVITPVEETNNISRLEEKLGYAHMHDLLKQISLDQTTINNMSALEFNRLLDDSSMWKHLHGQLKDSTNQQSRCLRNLNQHWPANMENLADKSMVKPELDTLEQGIRNLTMFSIREPLLQQLAEQKNSWDTIIVFGQKLQKAAQLLQEGNLPELQTIKEELAQVAELEKTGRTWKKLLLAEKVLQAGQWLCLAEAEFSGSTSYIDVGKAQDCLGSATSLLDELSDTAEKEPMAQRLQKLQGACQACALLQRFSFHRLERLAIQEFDRAKNAALGSSLSVLQNLAIEKNNECLENFDYYVSSLESREINLSWSDVEDAGKVLNSLHLLTANTPGSGVRKQEIDTRLRNKIDSLRQELNNKLIARQKEFLAGGGKNRQLLIEMLPLAEPKGRWHVWIEKQMQQIP